MTTPGRPEKEKPATSNGQASSTWVQCRPTWYQMLGMPGDRCGSLASSGRPDSVCVPDTTQEFEPTPSPLPSRSGTASSAACADSSAERPARTARRVSASGAVSARCRLARCGGRRRVSGRGVALGAQRARQRRTRRPVAGQDRGVGVGRVRRVERVHQRDVADAAVGDRPAELLVVVAAQVPGHRLEPRQGVDRGPRLDLGDVAGEVEHRVGGRQVGGRAALHVGVDAVGVVLQVLAGARRQQRQLLLGDPAPAERAHDAIGLQRVGVLAHQLGQPAGGDVAAQVHLEEPVLGVDVALRVEQVARGVGVDLRDAARVAQHLDVGRQAGDLDRAGPVRQRTADGDHHGDDHDEDHRDQQRHGGEGDASEPRHPPSVTT